MRVFSCAYGEFRLYRRFASILQYLATEQPASTHQSARFGGFSFRPYAMSKMSAPEMTSYAGGVASIGASLTLTEIGVIVGIVTALLTFGINAVYMYRKDKREQRESDAAMAKWGAGK